MQQKQWRKLNGITINQPLTDEVKQVLQRELAADYKIKVCIGSDSQVKDKNIEFATVIVFVRQGKGAFMYINNETIQRKMALKERMLAEVSRSIEVAYELCQLFIAFNIDMEIHADINTNANFKSNTALKDAMGFIMGMGFVFKVKPNAFAGSKCADKMVH